MKAQNTSKLAKKTVFIYKSIKAENNYVTMPTGDQSHVSTISYIV